MGIDPVTHKPKSQALYSGQLKDAANVSHMAQWEGARLEAEARLVRESKLHVTNPFQTHLHHHHHLLLNKAPSPPSPLPSPPVCLDVLTAWKGTWLKSPKDNAVSGGLELPTSTLNFAENPFPIINTGSFPHNSLAVIDQLVNKLNNLPEIKERI
ncbi:transcription factor MYB106-like [Camellia sinensis]|uniref:transcription factor MYB106-like n=1 Tax=Camellia sinensis TaxID=4442 RepID=UPI001036D2FB|nr:transcription factor MYB106-like [Camellia sinensis]